MAIEKLDVCERPFVNGLGGVAKDSPLNNRVRSMPNKFFECFAGDLPLCGYGGFGWVAARAEEGSIEWVNPPTRRAVQAERSLAANANKHFSFEKREVTLLERCQHIVA